MSEIYYETDDDQPKPVLIPIEKISPQALHALVEAFILREGTDYGQIEYSIDDKIADVKKQIEVGDVVLSFDFVTQSPTLLLKRQYDALIQQSL